MVNLGSWPLVAEAVPLGLGLAALGRPGYINLGHAEDLGRAYDPTSMQDHANRVLDAAWQAGIRYFDAARSYGRAEEFLEKWLHLRNVSPEQVTVASKWGYTYTADWRVKAERHEVKEHTLPVLRRQWQETQGHLAKYLDLYQIHSATLESGVLTDCEVLDELARIKEGGVRIGLSLSGESQADTLRRALAVERGGMRLFDAVQATWNLLETSATDELAAASAVGMTVIVKESLANGRLTTRNEDPEFRRKMHVLQGQARRLGTSVDALALSVVLARPWVDVVLSGAATARQAMSNVAALRVDLDEEAVQALAAMAEPPETYWATRSALAWN